MRFLEDHYLPDLSSAIIAEKFIDPRHFETVLSSYLGAAFSFQPTLRQSAWFRPHNRSEDFDNLYFVGRERIRVRACRECYPQRSSPRTSLVGAVASLNATGSPAGETLVAEIEASS